MKWIRMYVLPMANRNLQLQVKILVRLAQEELLIMIAHGVRSKTMEKTNKFQMKIHLSM